MFQLHDKIALVTGAAQGMGRAHAIALASQGAKVILTDRKTDLCKKVVEEIVSKGGEAACFSHPMKPVTSPESRFTCMVGG
jgi:cyclopentanol dehydrogenase